MIGRMKQNLLKTSKNTGMNERIERSIVEQKTKNKKSRRGGDFLQKKMGRWCESGRASSSCRREFDSL
jgi:hypothetical protein